MRLFCIVISSCLSAPVEPGRLEGKYDEGEEIVRDRDQPRSKGREIEKKIFSLFPQNFSPEPSAVEKI